MYIFPPHLYTVAALPSEMQKSFLNSIFIHTSDYLHYLRRKQTVTPYPSHLKNVTALPCKMLNFFVLTEHNVAFLQMLVALCGNWNVRQATSQQLLRVTTFCTDTRLQSFFATNQLHRPPRSAEIQHMLQKRRFRNSSVAWIGTRYMRSCSLPQMR